MTKRIKDIHRHKFQSLSRHKLMSLQGDKTLLLQSIQVPELVQNPPINKNKITSGGTALRLLKAAPPAIME